MKRWLYGMFASAARSLRPAPPMPTPTERVLTQALAEAQARESARRTDYLESVEELAEAVQMAGSGPWKIGPAALQESQRIIQAATEPRGMLVKESAQGAFGDLELALQDVEWRREVNFSLTQFSRWGIQQIILISRLYYIKNPIIRRLINICSAYVFGRGVEVSSPDEKANDVLKEFMERNQHTFGTTALIEAERRKGYDGNLFWAFFADTVNAGLVSVRMIDATEIQDVICDPEDSDSPQFYKRIWTVRTFDPATGKTASVTKTAWYPALNYDPPAKPETIGQDPVMWVSPIYHRRCGFVGKWSMGCPLIYPAIDWAKTARKYLEDCATKAHALSQFAFTLTTKGGQQALAGMKDQLGTNAGPNSQTGAWDSNPTATAGSIFGSGPGTKLDAMVTRGAGDDPEEVRQYKLMCCMVMGVPETFLADVSTGNLATATTLDRPTELVFLEKQEMWREDLQAIAQYVLKVSLGAPKGKLRESLGDRRGVVIREARRVPAKNGVGMVEMLCKRVTDDGVRWFEAGRQVGDNEILVSVNFPAIREGDVPQLVTAAVQAMTLGNSQGNIVGIDAKAGVRHLYDVLGIENGDELTEEQYPDATYDPERDDEPPPVPVVPAPVPPIVQPPKAKAAVTEGRR